MKSKFFATVLKGFIIIIPILALALLLRQFLDLISNYVNKMMGNLGLDNDLQIALVTIASILVILLAAYLVGLISDTKILKNFSKRVDEELQNISVVYRTIKLRLDNSSAFMMQDRPPVFVMFGDAERPGFLINAHPELAKTTVFIPKDFNNFQGEVYIVDSRKVRKAKESKNEFVLHLNHLGDGLDIS